MEALLRYHKDQQHRIQNCECICEVVLHDAYYNIAICTKDSNNDNTQDEEAWPYMTIKMSALLEASVIPKLKGRLTRSSNSKMDY